MADNNDKLSLHIASKNITTLNSGFVDVPAIPTISGRISLNRQTVVGVGNDGPAEIGVTATGGAIACKLWTQAYFSCYHNEVGCANYGYIHNHSSI